MFNKNKIATDKIFRKETPKSEPYNKKREMSLEFKDKS